MKFKSKLDKLEYYFENNYVNKDNLIKTLDEFEIKLKPKLTFINSSLYNEIDRLQESINYNYSYSYNNTKKSTKKKYEDVFDYVPEIIEEDDEDDEDWNSENEEYISVKKTYTNYNAKPKQSFAKYLFVMCLNREQINSSNINNFTNLKNIDEFIQFDDSENSVNSVKILLKEVYDNKILSLNSYTNLNENDIKILLKLNFDKITMRNAILIMNITIIELLFDNKYSGSQNDILNIRYRICDKNNKSKYDYNNTDNNFTQFDEIVKVLDVFAKYNIYIWTKILYINFVFKMIFTKNLII